MRYLLSFAALTVLALAPNAYAQESKRESAKPEITKSTYLIGGIHCQACVSALERSLKAVKGVDSVNVDFQLKSAAIGFDERVISAQELARKMSYAPHAMGPSMHYSGTLLLGVAGVHEKGAAKKATAALRKVKGVANVMVDPRQDVVGIQFAVMGRVTSKRLIEALATAGFKGSQYDAGTR
jgi:copper chaperone CopZ